MRLGVIFSVLFAMQTLFAICSVSFSDAMSQWMSVIDSGGRDLYSDCARKSQLLKAIQLQSLTLGKFTSLKEWNTLAHWNGTKYASFDQQKILTISKPKSFVRYLGKKEMSNI